MKVTQFPLFSSRRRSRRYDNNTQAVEMLCGCVWRRWWGISYLFIFITSLHSQAKREKSNWAWNWESLKNASILLLNFILRGFQTLTKKLNIIFNVWIENLLWKNDNGIALIVKLDHLPFLIEYYFLYDNFKDFR